MKKVLLFLLMLPLMLLAAPVDPNMAQQVAENFINAPEVSVNNAMRKAPRKPKRMARAAKQVTNDQQFYVFNSEDGEGFVIVAADNVARPILGYSKTGTFDMENIPANKRGWLSMYNDEIKYAQSHNLQASSETQQAWNEVLENQYAAAEVVVAPLLTTTWDQSPYYNALCPMVTQQELVDAGIFTNTYRYYTGRAVTGCAATALAQVMNYWEWPKQGKGIETYPSTYAGTLTANFGATEYDWAHMPDSLYSQSTQQEIEAVGTLMYHCGVAMHMEYGLAEFGGSSATPEMTREAAVKYFRYAESTSIIESTQYSSSQWMMQIRNQLSNGIPMVYYGYSAPASAKKRSGHAFVCDGYSSDGAFHFNWGWGGIEQDEYYFLTALTPGGNGTGAGGHNYTYCQGAIVGMVPDSGATAKPNLQMNSNLSLSQNSITYGGSVVLTTNIKNVGNAPFTGDILAMVIDTAGNYITDFTIRNNYTIGISNTANISYTIRNNALIVPGQYFIILGSNCLETGLVELGSNSYLPFNTLKVTYSAPIEKKSAFEIYSDCNNELTTGHQIWFRVTFGNTSSSTFTGRIALALYDPETLQLAQLVSEISFALTGIGANEERTVNFIDTIRLEPKSYLAALVYSNDGQTYNFVGSTYSQNPCMVRVISDPAKVEDDAEPTEEFELKSGKYVIVASRNKTGDKNWYYMTSDLGTASTKRFQAISTGTESIDAITITDLEDKYVWTLEADGTNWKLKNGTKYITWTSGNSANLGATAKSLTFEVADNQVQAHFNDGTNERYLSLNATTNNNYFAFYSGTNQITNLFFLPYQEETPEPQQETDNYVVLARRNAKSNWFYMTSDLGTASNKRYQAVDAGTTSLANVNTSNLDSKYYWQIEENKLHTTAGYSAWTSGNTALLNETGKELNIEKQTDGTFTFSFADGTNTRYLAFNQTVGNNYFAYYSGTNQIYKLTLVKEGESGTATAIEEIETQQQTQSATKLLRNGQIFILRGEKVYTLTGQEVK